MRSGRRKARTPSAVDHHATEAERERDNATGRIDTVLREEVHRASHAGQVWSKVAGHLGRVLAAGTVATGARRAGQVLDHHGHLLLLGSVARAQRVVDRLVGEGAGQHRLDGAEHGHQTQLQVVLVVAQHDRLVDARVRLVDGIFEERRGAHRQRAGDLRQEGAQRAHHRRGEFRLQEGAAHRLVTLRREVGAIGRVRRLRRRLELACVRGLVVFTLAEVTGAYAGCATAAQAGGGHLRGGDSGLLARVVLVVVLVDHAAQHHRPQAVLLHELIKHTGGEHQRGGHLQRDVRKERRHVVRVQHPLVEGQAASLAA
mmetsp:Transcript_18166/g.46119  ORF Transcript_18166/g.46119 Transcript_18166/m.46119 type:complete len:315 (-) Transcript_18166:792-1736(-)